MKKFLLAALLICLPLLAEGQSSGGDASLSQDAKTFIDQFWTEWSSPNSAALPYIEFAVDNQVNFYGKPISREAFMKAEAAFAQRWPDRQYKAQDGSETITCNDVAATCNVSGIVNWTNFSLERGVLSAGLEKFSFSLREQTIDGMPLFLVTGESGSVISRSIRQLPGDAAGIHTPGGMGKTYIGPGDLVPGATAYYGMRAYDALYAAVGGKAVQLRRASDGALTDIRVRPDGALDNTAVRAFCQNTSCYITIWYDQTRHGNDVSQQAPSQQPLLQFSTGGRPPVVQFDHDRMTYLSGAFPWVSGNQPWSGQVALLNVSPTDWYEPLFGYGTTAHDMSLFAELNGRPGYQFFTSIYDNDEPSNVTAFAPVAATFFYTGSVAGGSVNGTAWSDPFGGAAITGSQFNIGGSPQQVGIWLTGGLGEITLYPFSLSTVQIQSLAADERRFFGF